MDMQLSVLALTHPSSARRSGLKIRVESLAKTTTVLPNSELKSPIVSYVVNRPHTTLHDLHLRVGAVSSFYTVFCFGTGDLFFLMIMKF